MVFPYVTQIDNRSSDPSLDLGAMSGGTRLGILSTTSVNQFRSLPGGSECRRRYSRGYPAAAGRKWQAAPPPGGRDSVARLIPEPGPACRLRDWKGLRPFGDPVHQRGAADCHLPGLRPGFGDQRLLPADWTWMAPPARRSFPSAGRVGNFAATWESPIFPRSRPGLRFVCSIPRGPLSG